MAFRLLTQCYTHMHIHKQAHMHSHTFAHEYPHVRVQSTMPEKAPLAQEPLRLQPLVRSAEMKHGEHCVGKGLKRVNAKGIHLNSQQVNAEDTGEIFNARTANCRKVQEDLRLVAQLKTCAQQKDLYSGSRIHVDISRRGLLKENVFVASALVNMYAKCGALVKAQKVLDGLPLRNIVSWNGLMAGYAQHGLGYEALVCFERMQEEGLLPNARTFTCALKACGSIGDVEKGKKVFSDIVREGLLGTDILLGNALVDMFGKCGALAKAQQVFDELRVRNVVSWNSLIAGYCHHGCGAKALNCFEQMKHEGLTPDVVTFACILTASGSIGAILRGKEIHEEIARKGLLSKGCVLCTALMDMYAKCGSLAKAREVFDELCIRDVVSWTALITGYCQHGHGEEALDCFERMKREGLSPDAVTFASVLKACGSIGAAEKGKEIHAEIVREGLLGRVAVLWSALMDMYVKCGALAEAREVFDKLPSRDVVSWTSLIAGYCQHGHSVEAIVCFEQMKREGFSPDAMSFSCILRACGNIGAAEKGQLYYDSMRTSYGIIPTIEHHTCMVDLFGRAGRFDKVMALFEKMHFCNYLPTWFALMDACQKWGNVNLGKLAFKHAVQLDEKSVLAYVHMSNVYAAVGMQEDAEKTLAKAQQVVEDLSIQDVVSWNTLISGYCQIGCGEEALKCFERMKQEGVSLDAVTCACILKACSSIGAHDKGKEIHAEIMKEGLLGKVTVLGNALVDMYAKCGALGKAQRVFDELPVWNRVSWNALITGYCQHRHGEKALYCLERMEHEGISPDAVTFACLLNACGGIGAAEKGKDIHSEIARKGLLVDDIVLGNALVDMYAKCGFPSQAQQVFDELPLRNIVSWNTLITGCCQYEYGEEAFKYFECMKREGLSPNAVTLACILKVCGRMGAFEKGKEIHAEIIGEGFLGEVSILGNAVVNMYAKCGALAKAHQVLNMLPVKNLVSWNGLIAGYCRHGHGEEAVNCFERMKHEGLFPNVSTFAYVLKACGSMGALEMGKEIHAEIVKEGLLGSSSVLGSALVNMYTKCGALAKARELFDNLPVQDVVSWTALITGYCQFGHGKEALYCFERMKNEGLLPDAVTFACILKACGTIGVAEKGPMYLETVRISCGIIPTLEHYTCMVNLLSHAGYFDKAVAEIKKLPSSYYLLGWFALMHACQKWGNVKLGRLAFEHAVQVDGNFDVAL